MYEEYKKGIDCWREKHGNNTSRVATLAIISDKGAIATSYTACHAGLHSSCAIDLSGRRQYVVSGIQNTRLSEADRQLYIDWLVQRSPYESAFPVKDAAWLIEQRCLIGTAHVPSNILAGGLIASRFQSEDKNTGPVQLMIDLIKAGVQEDLAFLVCHYTNVGKRVSFYNGDSVHSVLPVSIRMGAVNNFFSRRFVNLNQTYAQSTEYYGVCNMFGSDGGCFPSWLAKNFTIEEPKEQPKAKSVNPFLKAKVEKVAGHDGNTYEREQFIRAMVRFQHTIFEKVGYDQGIHHQQQLAV